MNSCEVKSESDEFFGAIRNLSVKIRTKDNAIRVMAHRFRIDLPLWAFFVALGIESDLEIVKMIVYDVDAHACIIDGVRLHMGKRFTYRHNDLESMEKNLQRATKLAEETGGGILFITEGVFGMRGQQGKLKEIVEMKKKYNFRLLVDDAHGFGTLGKTGAGAGEEQDCQDGIDVYFSTFAKSMASIGAFLAADKDIIDYLLF